jgi:hypothetical protein
MRKLFTTLALFTAATLSLPALGADKLGMPPSKIDINGNVKPAFNGCAVAVSTASTALTAIGAGVNVASIGGDFSCDMQRNAVVFGARIGYDFGESDARFMNLGLRAGFLINPSVLAYGLVTLTMDGRSPKIDDSILSGGVGAEMQFLSPRTFLYIELTKNLKGFGDASLIDDATIGRLGMKYRW